MHNKYTPHVKEHQEYYAKKLEKYWRDQGYKNVKFFVQHEKQKIKLQNGKNHYTYVYAIKSNLVNGMPI